MEASGASTNKKRAVTAQHWELVLEALAWAVVGAFVILLLQARQVSRWNTQGRVGMLVVVLLFGIALTYLRKILFSQFRRFKSVESESFLLKRDGVVLATLGPSESFGARLTLCDLSGTPMMTLGSDPTRFGTSLLLSDVYGKQRMRLGEDEIEMFDEAGIKKLSVGLNGLGEEPNISLFSGDGRTIRMRLAVHDGDPSITLIDEEEEERAAMELIGNSTRLSLVGKSSVLCFLGDKGDKEPIQVFDANGKVIWSAP